MKNSIIEEIKQAVDNFEATKKFFEDNSKADFSNRVNKIKIAAIVTKCQHYLNKVLILNEFLENHFNESYSLSESLVKAKEDYQKTLGSIMFSNGSISFSKEYENMFNEIETKMSKSSG